MRNIAVKQDNVGDTLTAGDFNALNEEIENIILSAGFALDPAGGPDTDKNMLGKTGAAYGSAAWRYADSGSANTYVLSRVAGSALKNVEILHDGMAISFEAGATNTGASTVNQVGLGAKALVLRGSALVGGEVIAGEQIIAFWDEANDRYELVPIGEATETTGFVKEWPTATAPGGYLECDGSAISRTTYADLFAVLSTTYGVGDGSTTFNLPDYRGEMLRGWDHGKGSDPDAASRTDRGDGTTGDNVGTRQLDAEQEHIHYNGIPDNVSTSFVYNATNVDLPGFATTSMNTSAGITWQGKTSITKTDGVSGTPRTSTETRSRNVDIMLVIKT